MFDRYTEKARRVIFFARYEASAFGSPYIETEHLSLGILREDPMLTRKFSLRPEAIRSEIDKNVVVREKISTSVDLPLSNECKRVLAYAAEEAESGNVQHIGVEHLFVGLLREEKSFAADLLQNAGVRLKEARAQISDFSGETAVEGHLTRRRLREGPVMEFIENGKAVPVRAHMLMPRAGDEIVLELGEQQVTYKVESVRLILGRNTVGAEADIQSLKKVQVTVSRVSG